MNNPFREGERFPGVFVNDLHDDGRGVLYLVPDCLNPLRVI